MASNECPVCREPGVKEWPRTGDHTAFDCITCGDFDLSGSVLATLDNMRERDPRIDGVLSFAIRQRHKKGTRLKLDVAWIKELVENTPAPDVAEQAENLIVCLGDATVGLEGKPQRLEPREYRSVIGASGMRQFIFIGEELLAQGLLSSSSATTKDGVFAALSFAGWQRYRELKRGRSESRRILMAMPFGPDDVRQAFEAFKPAVKQAGFELYNLGEDHAPGLIDDKLRVAIRTSRFLVADLTHGNQGAYWEAGFAEGLGKPVIYTCEEGYFKTKRVHFDTGHLHHVLWTLDDLGGAAERLKSSIRATPGLDAKMEDDAR